VIGRQVFQVLDLEQAPPKPTAAAASSSSSSSSSASSASYTIRVDFGEWNVKNGYTSPAVKPNRYT
jgi:hypothetical protein